MNEKKLDPAQLTDKDCDDWFSILKGKTVQDAHPEIQQDAHILRTLVDEYQQEKIAKKKDEKQWISPQPAFLLMLLLAIPAFLVYKMIPNFAENTGDTTPTIVDGKEKEDHSEAYANRGTVYKEKNHPETSSTGIAIGFTPIKGESQSDLVNALNTPVIVNDIQEYIEQLVVVFGKLGFEQQSYKDGFVVSITLKEKPSEALLAQLQEYGFSGELTRQYMYFKEKPMEK